MIGPTEPEGERGLFRSTLREALEGLARQAPSDPSEFDLLLAELGCWGLGVPIEFGGAGEQPQLLQIVLEEVGRSLCPARVVSTAVLGTSGISLAGTSAQRQRFLPDIVAGALKPTATIEANLVRAISADDGLRIEGTADFVPDASESNLILTACMLDGNDSYLVAVSPDTPGVTIDRLATVDRTRRFGRVHFRGAVVSDQDVLGGQPVAQSVLQVLRDRAAVAIACDSIGGAERALEITVTYAKGREQFGRPIGSFQAIKHRCADMAIIIEAARAVTNFAVSTSDAENPAEQVNAAASKTLAADAYASVAGDCVQVLGGIGYTWDHPMHRYLKRAKLNQALYGTSQAHRDRIAAHLVSALASG